jgi:hypothetical protein
MDKIKKLLSILRKQTPKTYVAFAVLPFCWQRMAGNDWDLICTTFSITREIGILHALPYILGCVFVTLVTLAALGVILHLRSKQLTALSA